MAFQTLVQTRPSMALAGDFASDNPRDFYPAGPGGLVAGASGVTVARFAWVSQTYRDWDGGPAIANSFGVGAVAGFVHRNQQALITTYLAESGSVIPNGFGLALLTSGDIWIKNDGTTEAAVGMYAYANYADGKATFALTGSPTAGGSTTAGTVVASSSQTFTGYIVDNVLTVSVATTAIVIGSVVSTTGLTAGSGNAAPASQILKQLDGTANGAGTYQLSVGEQTVGASTSLATFTQDYGTLTAASTSSGLAVGETLTGTGVATGTTITQLGTGTGGNGTYYVYPSTAVGPVAMSGASNVQTKWFAYNTALPGELVRCGSQALG